jgi:hypothetical protein
MDVNQKVDQARDKYRLAAEDLRSSYDKNTKDLKENFDNKTAKQSNSYDAQKTKLEEQNLVSNELYSDKTKKAISESQVAFRNDIKKNAEKFDNERNVLKAEFSDKLSNLSDSYQKSTAESNRFNSQITKTMGERYQKANLTSKADFDQQVEKLESKVKDSLGTQKLNAHKEMQTKEASNQSNLEDLRNSGQEQKFKEVSSLRNDNENLRTNFGHERESMREQQDARVADILNLKNKENEEGQKNFSNLQQNIREKNIAEELQTKNSHQNEAKDLEKKFKDDLRNVQQVANQKIRGGTEVSSLDNKQLIASYENRLQAAKLENRKDREEGIEKAKEIDLNSREKLKETKIANIDDNERREAALSGQHKSNFQELKDKNNLVIDRYKADAGASRVDSEAKLSKADLNSKEQLKNQRVEFGKYANTINSKKLDEISSIKTELNKDKSNFIEKTKRDLNDEKLAMKTDLNRQLTIKNDIYEEKLSEMAKQTNKIIENYENRIGQIARKAETEVQSLKSSDVERRAKETQAIKIAFDTQERQHQMDVGNIREKYERMIGKDRALNEQQTNRIVQKYEDQLGREKIDNQKELSMRLSEADAKFERVFKSSELEKESIRNQYEERIENMKLASLSSKGNSKKA